MMEIKGNKMEIEGEIKDKEQDVIILCLMMKVCCVASYDVKRK